MEIYNPSLNIHSLKKEMRSHGTEKFPCALYFSEHGTKEEDIIFWHWHSEIEIIYIEEGCMEVRTPGKSYTINAHEGIAINRNVLHYLQAAPYAKLSSFVFSPDLITGSTNSIFAEKYIYPLINCPVFDGLHLTSDIMEDFEYKFTNASIHMKNHDTGYEFITRNTLSDFILCLYIHYHEALKKPIHISNPNHLRVQTMLQFIHENFSDRISLEQISNSANIGKREALRCFSKTIATSPIQYLLKYRIIRGAEMLINNPNASISEIAISCGFDSPSNFSYIFKKFYNCTPRDYRRANLD